MKETNFFRSHSVAEKNGLILVSYYGMGALFVYSEANNGDFFDAMICVKRHICSVNTRSHIIIFYQNIRLLSINTWETE